MPDISTVNSGDGQDRVRVQTQSGPQQDGAFTLFSNSGPDLNFLLLLLRKKLPLTAGFSSNLGQIAATREF